MSEHFIVTLDQGHLRIYVERQSPEQFTPGLEQVEAMDFPAGRERRRPLPLPLRRRHVQEARRRSFPPIFKV